MITAIKYPVIEKIRKMFARFVYPLTCVYCGEISENGSPLCHDCFTNHFLQTALKASFLREDDKRCIQCGRPLISSTKLCTVCRNTPLFTSIDRIITLYPYTFKNQELLAEWKINGMRGLSWLYAQCLKSVLEPLCQYGLIPVVPVPPRPGKIRNKGWDQIEELVFILEKNMGISIIRCLERTNVIQQKKLGKVERSDNLKGHIEIIDGFSIPETLIIIDDLMTTGATLDACAETLKSAGCRKVYGLTLFYD